MVKIDIAALTHQRNQRAIMGRLMLAMAVAVRKGQDHRHVGAIWEEFLIWSAVIANDDGKPVTIADIARALQIPRSNVGRAITALAGRGIVRKEGRGYVQELKFFADRIDSDCFVSARAAIMTAAAELRAVQK